jgi:hypothetical protein
MNGDSTSKLRAGDLAESNSNSTSEPVRVPGVDRDAWRIVRTGARREKIVARQCGTAGIACFLPLMRVAREYAGTTCRVEVPLFAGYLFARADEAALRAADASGSIRAVADAPQRAIGWQLRSLASALERGAPLEPAELSNGRRVEVRGGALAGVQGLVDDLTRADRLVLQIDALGLAFSTGIEGIALAPLD